MPQVTQSGVLGLRLRSAWMRHGMCRAWHVSASGSKSSEGTMAMMHARASVGSETMHMLASVPPLGIQKKKQCGLQIVRRRVPYFTQRLSRDEASDNGTIERFDDAFETADGASLCGCVADALLIESFSISCFILSMARFTLACSSVRFADSLLTSSMN